MRIVTCPKCGCSEPMSFIKDGICLKKESEDWLGIKIWDAGEEKNFRRTCKEVAREFNRGKQAKQGGIMKYCRATIRFGDDYADNCTTFHCQLIKGHKGRHQEKGDMGYGEDSIPYILEWKEKSRASKVDKERK